jgi:hypothetical protein
VPTRDTLFSRQVGQRSWRGLLISVGVHGLLAWLACWIIFRIPQAPVKRHDEVFVVAGGGASAPPSAPSYATSQAQRVDRMTPQRLSVESVSATIAIPELPKCAEGAATGLGGAGLGQGLGGGFGGLKGVGSGLGSGAGYVGKCVMGAMIKAQKVAVYLDCSGSMRPYLARVTAEIKKQYPTADVFRFDGARVVALGDEIIFGRNFRGDAPRLTEAPTQTVEHELTVEGRQLQVKIRAACEKGSLGAWIDRMLGEPYDALVVFSDFMDGIRVYEARKTNGFTQVYSDSAYHKVGQKLPSGAWQRRWLEAFKGGASSRGLKVYLFSIDKPPQGFLQACVEASGGSSSNVGWLRQSVGQSR